MKSEHSEMVLSIYIAVGPRNSSATDITISFTYSTGVGYKYTEF